MNDFFFLNMKREWKTVLWGEPTLIKDFYTSRTVPMVERDINRDGFGVRAYPGAKDWKVVVDLGANVGMWSIAIARKNPHVKVYAVEPMLWNCDNLALNLHANEVKNVEIYRIAISGRREKITVHQHPLNSGGCSVRNPAPFPAYEVDAVSLDQFLEDLKINQVDFLKMDIEGAEFDVLKNFTGWHKIKRMGLEMHGHQGTRAVDSKDEMQELFDLAASKIGKENLHAVTYDKTYHYGDEIPYGLKDYERDDLDLAEPSNEPEALIVSVHGN